MERVETLCTMLAEKIKNKANINDLISTVKMLESELMHLKNITPPTSTNSIVVSAHIAKNYTIPFIDNIYVREEETTEKIIEVLQVNEEDIEAELEEIKKNAEQKNNLSLHTKHLLSDDDVNEIPTFAVHNTKQHSANQHKEVNEVMLNSTVTSLNETLHKPLTQVGDLLQEAPVKDLKKAIGINDKFRFLHELFKGDEAVYERSIKTINNFEILPEAEFWIRRELKLKYTWSDTNETVKQFDQLVKRRFASM